MKKNFFLFFITLLIITGCAQKPDVEKIRIATLRGPSAIGMVKMIDSLNQLENSTIEIKIYNEPIQVRKLMLENEVDFAVLPTTMGAILYNKGIPYKLAAIPVWGTLYLFGNDTTISSWSNLKGKRIHLMAKGMTPDVLFKYLLVENNINPNEDVILDYSFPTHIDLANAVAANQADLAVISEPLVSLVMQKNKNVYPLMDLNLEWQKINETPITQTGLLVHKDFVNQNKNVLNELLKSYENSSKWVTENPEKASKLVVKYGILPSAEVAESSIPRCNLNYKDASEIKKEILEYLNTFYELNPLIVGNKIPDDNFFVN